MKNSVKENIVVVCLDYAIGLNVAKSLADRLDMYFLDLQGLYEFDIKPRTIADTIKEYGIDYYRKEIGGSVKYVSTFDNSVIVIESGAFEDETLIEKVREHCLFVYIRSFPKWVTNENYDGNYKSSEEETLYKLKDGQIIARDKTLCENAEIIAYGDDNDLESYVGDIISKIKLFYGV